MGVFYNPQGPMPIAQMGFQTQIGGATGGGGSRAPKGRDIQAEKWDKEQADEKRFIKAGMDATNPDTGEMDLDQHVKNLRLAGFTKEAVVLDEQYSKSKKARLEQEQASEMEGINDYAQALQFIASGSPHLKKRGLSIVQEYDPDIVDIQQDPKNKDKFIEKRADGTTTEHDLPSVWKSLSTGIDLLKLKQADDQFALKSREEAKRWSTDQLKALSLEKHMRIEARKQQGLEVPNTPEYTLTKADLENTQDIYGANPYLKTAATAMMADPTFRIRMLRDSAGALQELNRGAKMLQMAEKGKHEVPKGAKFRKEKGTNREIYSTDGGKTQFYADTGEPAK